MDLFGILLKKFVNLVLQDSVLQIDHTITQLQWLAKDAQLKHYLIIKQDYASTVQLVST